MAEELYYEEIGWDNGINCLFFAVGGLGVAVVTGSLIMIVFSAFPFGMVLSVSVFIFALATMLMTILGPVGLWIARRLGYVWTPHAGLMKRPE